MFASSNQIEDPIEHTVYAKPHRRILKRIIGIKALTFIITWLIKTDRLLSSPSVGQSMTFQMDHSLSSFLLQPFALGP